MAEKKTPAQERSSNRRSEAQKARWAEEAKRKREAELAVIEQRWKMARARFETEPRETLAALAVELGISRQRLSAKAIEQGWKKAMDSTALAHAANMAADSRPVDMAPTLDAAPPPPIPPHPTRPPRDDSTPPDRLLPANPGADLHTQAANDAVDQRAELVVRQRGEWKVVGGLLQEAVSKRDNERAKLAERVARSLNIKQLGERRAWGLDLPVDPTPGALGQATVIVKVLREGAPPVMIEDEDDDA